MAGKGGKDSTKEKTQDSSKATKKRGRKPSLKNMKAKEKSTTVTPSPEGVSNKGESGRPKMNVAKVNLGKDKLVSKAGVTSKGGESEKPEKNVAKGNVGKRKLPSKAGVASKGGESEKPEKNVAKGKGKLPSKAGVSKKGGEPERPGNNAGKGKLGEAKLSSKSGVSNVERESEGPGNNVGKGKLEENKLLSKVELPKSVRVLMDCEAATILEGIQDHFHMLSGDLPINIPKSFANALRYTQLDAQKYSDYQDVAKALQKLKEVGASDIEICMIANVGPVSTDEVYAFIPTLKGKQVKKERVMKEVLADLVRLKQPN